MGQTYTVKQGDHISGIAKQFGFSDYLIVWQDAGNAALRDERKNPHVLFPGDSVFIPDKKEKWEAGATTNIHTFQISLQPLHLRLVLKDFDEKALANTDCVLEVEGTSFPLTSDSTGLIEADIPATARSGELKIPDLDLEMPLLIGELDPPDEDSGWVMRLINLGYFDGEVDGGDKEGLRSALEEFQCDHGLKLTGDPDAATLQKLEEIHGV